MGPVSDRMSLDHLPGNPVNYLTPTLDSICPHWKQSSEHLSTSIVVLQRVSFLVTQ